MTQASLLTMLAVDVRLSTVCHIIGNATALETRQISLQLVVYEGK